MFQTERIRRAGSQALVSGMLSPDETETGWKL